MCVSLADVRPPLWNREGCGAWMEPWPLVAGTKQRSSVLNVTLTKTDLPRTSELRNGDRKYYNRET